MFIHIPVDDGLGAHRGVSNMILQLLTKDALSNILPAEFISLLDQVSKVSSATSEEAAFEDMLHLQRILRERGIDIVPQADAEAYEQFCLKGKLIARELSVSPGSLHVIVNGRVRQLFPDDSCG